MKTLCLGLIAMATMACLATSASAADFHSETSEPVFTGTQSVTNAIATDSGTIHCTTATFSGTAPSSINNALTVTPVYSGCVSTGFIKANVTVDVNGCKYTLQASGQIDLHSCTNAGKSLVVTAPFCTITFTEQVFAPVEYENTGSGTTRGVNLSFKAEGLDYHESGFACKSSGSTKGNGTYTGISSITAETGAGKHVGAWREGETLDFHSETPGATITGSRVNQHALTTDSGTIHCNTATFSGTAPSYTNSELTVTPVYSGCESTGFIKASVTVDVNGCKYTLRASGYVELKSCTNEGKSLVITAPFCTITFPEQIFAQTDYENAGSGITTEVNLAFTGEGVDYTETGFACKSSGSTKTNGTYTGVSSITAETEGGEHVGVWWELTPPYEFHSGHTYITVKGSPVGVNQVTFDLGTLECMPTSFHGTSNTPTTTTSELVLAPTYTQCESTGFIKLKFSVDVNGCNYSFTASGIVHIVGCTNANKSIVMTGSFCTVEIPEQTFESVTYTNIGNESTREVEVDWNVNNLKYRGSGGVCDTSGSTTSNGSFSGGVKLKSLRPSILDHLPLWRTGS